MKAKLVNESLQMGSAFLNTLKEYVEDPATLDDYIAHLRAVNNTGFNNQMTVGDVHEDEPDFYGEKFIGMFPEVLSFNQFDVHSADEFGIEVDWEGFQRDLEAKFNLESYGETDFLEDILYDDNAKLGYGIIPDSIYTPGYTAYFFK